MSASQKLSLFSTTHEVCNIIREIESAKFVLFLYTVLLDLLVIF